MVIAAHSAGYCTTFHQTSRSKCSFIVVTFSNKTGPWIPTISSVLLSYPYYLIFYATFLICTFIKFENWFHSSFVPGSCATGGELFYHSLPIKYTGTHCSSLQSLYARDAQNAKGQDVFKPIAKTNQTPARRRVTNTEPKSDDQSVLHDQRESSEKTAEYHGKSIVASKV